MGDKTGISWSEATWNPVTGCDRCSPGCDNCYALTHAARMKRMGAANYQTDGDPVTSGPGFGVACHPAMLDRPLRWAKPRKIFVNSMSDLFHSEVPTEFIVEVVAAMAVTRRHVFQVLTKRPARMRLLFNDPVFVEQVRETAAGLVGARGADVSPDDWCWPLPNVWMGVTVDTDDGVWRVDRLRDTPAAVRFVSAEPLLSAVPSIDLSGVDWLIVGGESGHGCRPMHPVWVAGLVESARAAGVAVWFKQWGGWRLCEPDEVDDVRIGRWVDLSGETFGVPGVGRVKMTRVRGKGSDLLDGRLVQEWPAVPVRVSAR